MQPHPSVIDRTEQPYVGVRALVTMQTIPTIADRIPELFGWLDAHGIEPAGPPFLKYNVIDMEREMEVEAGVPVAAAADGDGDVFAGVLPAGRYVTFTHFGHFDGIVNAVGDLLRWAREQGLAWDMTETDRGERWACRLEIYSTNPAEEPDVSKWETDLVFRLAG